MSNEIEGSLRKINFSIHERVSDAFIRGKHYVARENGVMVPCPEGDACRGFPYCHEGFDFVIEEDK
jgi:hypothetical protein